jgi:hypothetical protein
MLSESTTFSVQGLASFLCPSPMPHFFQFIFSVFQFSVYSINLFFPLMCSLNQSLLLFRASYASFSLFFFCSASLFSVYFSPLLCHVNQPTLFLMTSSYFLLVHLAIISPSHSAFWKRPFKGQIFFFLFPLHLLHHSVPRPSLSPPYICTTLFHAEFTVPPCRWGQQVSQKNLEQSAILYCDTSQNSVMFIVTTVRNLYVTENE